MVQITSEVNEQAGPEIWTVRDVAVYLRVSEAKIYRLVKEKRIPAARIGKTWRFRKDLLDAWISRSAELSLRVDGT